jgi:hypothetical protein
MAYYLYDDDGRNYVGQIASNSGMVDLCDERYPKLAEFMWHEEADAQLVKDIVLELRGAKDDLTVNLRNMLAQSKPPVIISQELGDLSQFD